MRTAAKARPEANANGTMKKLAGAVLAAFVLLVLFSSGGSAPASNSRLYAYAPADASASALPSMALPRSPNADAKWLGPQTGRHQPQQKPGVAPYVPPTYAGKYDNAWTEKAHFYHESCFGCWFALRLNNMVPFHTVLDAGTGNAELVRMMLELGKDAYGFEMSVASVEKNAAELVADNRVVPASVGDIPFADNSFDMVVSSDMLEHIPPAMMRTAVRELIRVTRRHIVMSISLKSYLNEGMHSNLHTRAYWERVFREEGAVRNEVLYTALQERDPRLANHRDLLSSCRDEPTPQAEHPDSPTFEVCTAKSPWLLWGQQLRPWRCVTTSNWELEPWMFTFTKLRGGECSAPGAACAPSA